MKISDLVSVVVPNMEDVRTSDKTKMSSVLRFQLIKALNTIGSAMCVVIFIFIVAYLLHIIKPDLSFIKALFP